MNNLVKSRNSPLTSSKVYSIPNTFMVLIAGVMIDKLGISFSSIFFISICMVGSLIFAAAFYLPYPLLWLLLGRTVLGFGGESLTVCQQTMLGRWFTGSFLNFAFGFTQVSSSTSLADSPPTATTTLYKITYCFKK